MTIYGRYKWSVAIALFLAVFFSAGPASAARIKDIAFVEGVRPNQLVGYGLVVGLAGTGDKTSAEYTMQSIANMLNRMGMKIDLDDIKVKNTAAVMVTAELPPFIKPGARIDALVSSLGDAISLKGGTLISTLLKGADGAVYATAQGPMTIGGFSAGGTTKVVKNHLLVGKLTNGAIIEKEVPLALAGAGEFNIVIKNPDFTTAKRIASRINESIKAGIAMAKDAGRVRVAVPVDYEDRLVEYISRIERLEVRPDFVTKVVVNERTGTVVMGENIKISTVAISHADLSIEIKTQYLISQPAQFSTTGETVVQPFEKLTIEEGESRLIILPGNVTLGEVVRALNLLGVTPRELIDILQAIKAAGALQADMEII